MKIALTTRHPTWSMGKGMKQMPFDFTDTFLGRDSHINLEYHGENSDSEECIFCLHETHPEGVWILLEKWRLGAWSACPF